MGCARKTATFSMNAVWLDVVLCCPIHVCAWPLSHPTYSIKCDMLTQCPFSLRSLRFSLCCCLYTNAYTEYVYVCIQLLVYRSSFIHADRDGRPKCFCSFASARMLFEITHCTLHTHTHKCECVRARARLHSNIMRQGSVINPNATLSALLAAGSRDCGM